MVIELDQRVQRERSFAIVDEVDNILIDEARTPLIISGQAEESADLYFTFARLVPAAQGPARGRRGGRRLLHRPQGQGRLARPRRASTRWRSWLGVENLYDADPRLARHFEQALRAHALYKRDRDYIVKDGEIVIVDEFTGRQMPGRRWSEGLHQAIEAKEGLRVQRESVTLATITFQNYFRLYDKLAGMTGTAMTEAEEFHKIYKLEVVAIPTHRPMIRDDDAGPRLPRRDGQVQRADRRDRRDARRPAGRSSSARSASRSPRSLATMLKRRGIKHEVAQRQVPREGVGHRRPGRPDRRGHDRHQHGRPRHRHPARRQPGRPRLRDPPQARPQPGRGGQGDLRRGARRGQGRSPTRTTSAVVEAGGLHIIGTERHDCAPDRQPAPRPRRPPGRPRLVALLPVARRRPDEALRLATASPACMERLGLEDDVAIESRLVSQDDRAAQSRVEGFNFDIRKRVVEFDDVINKQRETIYAERDKVLRNEDLTETVRASSTRRSTRSSTTTSPATTADEWNLEGSSPRSDAMGLDRRPGTTPTSSGSSARRDAIAEHLRDLADEQLEAREARGRRGRLGDRSSGSSCCATIDSLWVEHLTELDDMRRGIGLRGYAQQDPLNEFRREAFRLYEELRGLIRHRRRHDDLPGHGHPPAAAGAPTPGPAERRRAPGGRRDRRG